MRMERGHLCGILSMVSGTWQELMTREVTSFHYYNRQIRPSPSPHLSPWTGRSWGGGVLQIPLLPGPRLRPLLTRPQGSPVVATWPGGPDFVVYLWREGLTSVCSLPPPPLSLSSPHSARGMCWVAQLASGSRDHVTSVPATPHQAILQPLL